MNGFNSVYVRRFIHKEQSSFCLSYELNLKWNGRFWRKKKQTDSIFSENSIDPTSEVKDNTNHLKIKCILTFYFYSTPPTSEK